MLTMHEVRRKGSASRPAPQTRTWKRTNVDSRQAIRRAVAAVQAASGALGEGDTRPSLSEALERARKAEERVAESESQVEALRKEEVQYLDNEQGLVARARLDAFAEAEAEAEVQEVAMKLAESQQRAITLETERDYLRKALDEALDELNERPVVRIKAGWDRVKELEAELEATRLRHEVECERRVNEALKSVVLKG